MATAVNTEAGNDKVLVSMAFVKRNPDISREQFYHHWEHVHGPLVKPWAKKHGFISYRQIHLKPALNEGSKPIGPEATDLSGHASLSDYDGCAVMEVPSFEVFANAFKDEYYLSVIAPDEKQFVDKKVGVLRARGEVKQII